MRTILLCALICGFIFTGCGIKPPVEDLNVAKASLSKAEEANAKEFATVEYESANSKLKEGESLIVNKKSKKNEQAKKTLLESKTLSETAYKKSAPLWAEKNIADATKVKIDAESIKASVALKDEFSSAESVLNEAIEAKKSENYEQAWNKAIKAKNLFQEIYTKTLQKKNRAYEAIKNADSSIKDAQKYTGEE